MSLSLTDLRNQLRIEGRNVKDMSNYPNAQLDAAINRLCARFLRVTRCVKLSGTIDFVADDNEADFSDLAGFLDSRIERLRIDEDDNYTKITKGLDLTDIDNIANRLACNSTPGTPCMIGFLDSTTAKLYPAPTDDGTLTVGYAALQTPWQFGASSGAWSSSIRYLPGDVVSSAGSLYRAIITNTNVAVSTASTWLNLGTGTLVGSDNIVSVIPDGLMTELLGTGGPPILQAIDPGEQAFTGPQWQNYLDFEKECSGIGSNAGNVRIRTPQHLRGH